MSKCNSSKWINWETIPEGETKFTIPGGLFRPVLSSRHKRSSLHYLGIGTLIFQWEEQVHDLPQWYVFTMKHGPLRKLNRKIHYILDDIPFSYLVYESHTFVPEPFRTNKYLIAYDRGNSYCECRNTAKIDLINRSYQKNTTNTRCLNIITTLF